MPKLGWGEILLIAFVVILLFGGKKIPELMRGLGRGVREFKDGRDNVKKELDEPTPGKGRKTSWSISKKRCSWYF